MTATASVLKPRSVLGVVAGMPASDGAGVRLTRLVGQPRLQMLDPFLMLDHFDSDKASDYLAGFPDHPHRGFETVTFMLDGRLRHGDNKGHSGVIESGGVQWMTAGRGIVHSEMPEQQDGLMRGFQLWVNLPARLKMTEPKYQEFDAAKIPVETRGGATVKVVAGRTQGGAIGPVQADTVDALYLDVTLEPGAAFEQAVAAGHNAFFAVFEGSVAVEGLTETVGAVQIAVLGEGDLVRVRAGTKGARFLLIAGRPLGEPVAWGGPFVMNTREEVMQAYQDYSEGRFR
jgi:redox-sensitive bicupin YhaK (pirin superfamily)